MQSFKLPLRDVHYKNDNFIIADYDYNLQYYCYYRARFNQMKARLMKSAKNVWPGCPIYSLNDLAETKMDSDNLQNEELIDDNNPLVGKTLIVLGILLKKMSNQPNILKEIDDERKSGNPNEDLSALNCKFISDTDSLYLQENDESIELKGDVQIDRLCTGICAAVKGQINPNGSGFIVEDVCFIENTSQTIEKPFKSENYHVLLVSGLSFSEDLISNKKLSLSLNLLFDVVTGNSQLILNKHIVSIIIAGNNIKDRCDSKNSDSSLKKDKLNSYESIRTFDNFLANVGQYMFVDVMPGRTDLCTFLWPQQPLHPCLFPKAFRLSTIRSVTNPHRASYFGVDILGTSGENVESIRSCTSFNDSVEIMRNLLQWGHISPTCPDLLHSYPFSDNDPLVLNDYPDIFFAGNQNDFGIGSMPTPDDRKTIRLISIPKFSEKFIGVLVNLKTLDCEMLAFN
ncbi:breast cancer type 1 susceptibility protein-like [Sarcoptes scabiei]|nr:breast cancer type 1 susceptibility protein-like [Sarcoptes scabiei]